MGKITIKRTIRVCPEVERYLRGAVKGMEMGSPEMVETCHDALIGHILCCNYLLGGRVPQIADVIRDAYTLAADAGVEFPPELLVELERVLSVAGGRGISNVNSGSQN